MNRLMCNFIIINTMIYVQSTHVELNYFHFSSLFNFVLMLVLTMCTDASCYRLSFVWVFKITWQRQININSVSAFSGTEQLNILLQNLFHKPTS